MTVIIETGGKQLLVAENDKIFVEKLAGEIGSIIVLDKILAIDNQFGRPFLLGAKVFAEILRHGKQKKTIVYKYRPKKHSKTKYGHRQPYTELLIKEISLSGESKLQQKPNLEATPMEKTALPEAPVVETTPAKTPKPIKKPRPKPLIEREVLVDKKRKLTVDEFGNPVKKTVIEKTVLREEKIKPKKNDSN